MGKRLKCIMKNGKFRILDENNNLIDNIKLDLVDTLDTLQLKYGTNKGKKKGS